MRIKSMKDNFPIYFSPSISLFFFIFYYIKGIYVQQRWTRAGGVGTVYTPQICLKSKSSIIKLFPLDWCLLINYATNNILITSIIVTTDSANVCMCVSTPYFFYFIYFGPPLMQRYKKKVCTGQGHGVYNMDIYSKYFKYFLISSLNSLDFIAFPRAKLPV